MRIVKSFAAIIHKIGINPYVSVPEEVLSALFKQAKKSKGPIPVRGTIHGKPFLQTLVKYQGAWRLYINGEMRRAAGVDVGDRATLKVEYDPIPRIEAIPLKFREALSNHKAAKSAFERLPASRQKEMLRYLNSMKTETSLQRNIEKIIRHLAGEQTTGLGHLLDARD